MHGRLLLDGSPRGPTRTTQSTRAESDPAGTMPAPVDGDKMSDGHGGLGSPV
jgi:hypothetical protein